MSPHPGEVGPQEGKIPTVLTNGKRFIFNLEKNLKNNTHICGRLNIDLMHTCIIYINI